MTDAKLIAEIGVALFGPTWKADLARALEVSRDTVDDWSKGRMRPRPGVWDDLERIRAKRAGELERLAPAIERARATAQDRREARQA